MFFIQSIKNSHTLYAKKQPMYPYIDCCTILFCLGIVIAKISELKERSDYMLSHDYSGGTVLELNQTSIFQLSLNGNSISIYLRSNARLFQVLTERSKENLTATSSLPLDAECLNEAQ